MIRFLIHIFRRIRRPAPAGRAHLRLSIAATTAEAQRQKRPVAYRRSYSR